MHVKEQLEPKKEDFESQKAREKPKYKRKRKKNPLAPKQPPSAYNIFFKERYAYYKNQDNGLKRQEIVSKIAQDWRSLDDKSAYVAQAKTANEKYRSDVDGVKVYHTPVAIKKPPNAFGIYLREQMQLQKDQNHQDQCQSLRKRQCKEHDKDQADAKLVKGDSFV